MSQTSAALFIERDDSIDGPVATGQNPGELAVAIAQLQMTKTGALGRPEEFAGRRENPQIVVQIDPRLGAFFEEERFPAGLRLDPRHLVTADF